MRSEQAVSTLSDVDPQFGALCKTLFGDMVDADDVWHYLYGEDGVYKSTISVSRHRRGDVSKMNPVASDLADVGMRARGRLKRRHRRHAKQDEVQKNVGVIWSGEFSKVDDEKHQVFGWASVVEIDGKPIVDRQGDWISPDEIEKAAYKYVLDNRKGGHQHKRDDTDQPFHASSMIESFVITPEKIEKMGLPKETPCGWWVGYKVHDDEAWEKVKKGEVTGFSIHGRGRRTEVLA